MKKWIPAPIILFAFFVVVSPVSAKTASSSAAKVALPLIATSSTVVAPAATAEANQSSPSASIIQKIQEKKDQDITDTEGTQKDRLLSYLDQNPIAPLSWYNFLAHAIRSSIRQGVPPNIIVLVLLFPLIASIIAASRHIIGLRGFGIYIPAVLSVALVSTGPVVGMIIFLAIISVAVFSKRILKVLHLSYLPRTALLLWMISMSILFVLLLAPFLNLASLMTINIFPILILVLLSENFLDAQTSTKPADAFALALETIALAFVSGFFLRWEFMQKLALLQPELLILFTFVFNILVGRFVGLRVTEWLRFRPIIEE